MRTTLFLLLSVLSLCQNTWAQKENWTFSDRTGIKGVQLGVGNIVLGKPFQLKESLNQYVTEKASDSVNFRHAVPDKNCATIRLEVVYAPFRFNSNPWLKNIELMGGFSFRSYTGYKVTVYAGGDISPIEGTYVKHDYTASLKYASLNAAFSVNHKVSKLVMIYGRAGIGLGINNGLRLESGATEYTHYYDDTTNNVVNVNKYGFGDDKVYFSSQKSWHQEASIGLKVYVSCRVNLYAEYVIDNRIYKQAGRDNYTVFGQGFILGFRYKFNPPEAKESGEPEKKPSAFW